ncbi:MAG TPA: hypothetical protein VMR06_17130 [Dokdonella sp.]|uniref:hypothetical protein n=1 Tax=Dokdonella sp. TaxID=2291710 RepID=UPI002B5432AF|nr:hypothetical protein [Dokdonella sp.]HUD43712.1 hypothetical protein [Dokdonella sp.]
MVRWIMFGLIVLGIGVSLTTHRPGILGLGILSTTIGLFGLVFSIAAERVAARARPDSAMLGPEALAAIRERAQARRAAAPPPKPGAREPGQPGP